MMPPLEGVLVLCFVDASLSIGISQVRSGQVASDWEVGN